MDKSMYDTYNLIKRFVDNFDLFLYIKMNSCPSTKELESAAENIYLDMVEDERPYLFKHSDSSKLYLKYLDCFIEKKNDSIVINRQSFKELFSSFISLFFDDLVLCNKNEVEDENGNAYSFLYSKSLTKTDEFVKSLNELSAENASLHYQIMDRDQTIANMSSKNDLEKKKNSDFDSVSHELRDFISSYISDDITISKCMITDPKDKLESKIFEVSLDPGIYEGKRSSWFSPLQTAFTREYVIEKSVKNTSGGLLSRLFSLKHVEESRDSVKEKADYLDKERQKHINDLLASNLSNEEKYLKYILLTPGMTDDYMKTLDGCSDLHLDANIIIQLLEQPVSTYNKKIVESYVSKVHKGLEYDYKQEVVKELLNGDWFVFVEMNGQFQKMQLVPLDQILELKKYFERISEILDREKIINRSEPGDIVNDMDSSLENAIDDLSSNASGADPDSENRSEAEDNESMWEQYLSNSDVSFDEEDTSWLEDAL